MHTAGDMRWWPQQAHDTLHIAVTMDKGDISTKMQLVFLNTEHPQSPRAALPIALGGVRAAVPRVGITTCRFRH